MINWAEASLSILGEAHSVSVMSLGVYLAQTKELSKM